MIRVRRLVPLVLLVACSEGTSPKLDGGTGRDAATDRDSATDPDASPDIDALTPDAHVIDGPPGAYRHTVAIDGTDDFNTNEDFTTTSASFAAKVTWDDANVYVGYRGPDIKGDTGDAAQKWLFVYIDVDPGAATGATTSERYNTQAMTFPTGFGAEYYARWKADNSFGSIQQFTAGAWSMAQMLTFARTGTNDFVELAIPRSLFASASAVGVVTWMINETSLAEGTFAGLYNGNFTDGYAVNGALTKYLHVDFASMNAPNDPSNVRP